MSRGEPLHLPADWPVDQVFLDNLARVQDKLLDFQAALGVRLSRIQVVAAVRDAAPVPQPGAMAFFSGGVDGSYTACINRDRISRLLLIRGIDMQLGNDELWAAALQSGEMIATKWGMPFAALATNIRFLGYHHDMKWSRTFQGAGLASIEHLVPFEQVLVAASHAMESMTGFAPHPELEPLWSSSRTRFEYDGAVRRTTKLAALMHEPVVLERLRVCWHDDGYNCCRCEKCIRTMIALRLLGSDMPSFHLPLDLELLKALGTDEGGHLDYIDELDDLEREHPDPEIRRELDRLLAAERRRTRLRRIDAMTGGLLSAIRRRLRG